MSLNIRQRLAGRINLSASTYSPTSQDTERPSDVYSGRRSSAALSSERHRQRAHGGEEASLSRQKQRKRSSPAFSSTDSSPKSPPSPRKLAPSPVKAPPKKQPRVKRPRQPPPPPQHFQNVVMYYDAAGNLIMRETIDDVIGPMTAPKRRKNNIRVEDEMQAVYYLLDPVTLEEVQSTERNFHIGIFIKKESLQFREDIPGVRMAEACTTKSLGAHQISLGKKTSTPTIIVDKKRLIGTVLFTERGKVMVKYEGREIHLSQWDVFTMEGDEEFLIPNLSDRTVARIQILEWVN